VALSTQLLLTRKSTLPLNTAKADCLMESLKIRAIILTPILTGIKGYRHGGIND